MTWQAKAELVCTGYCSDSPVLDCLSVCLLTAHLLLCTALAAAGISRLFHAAKDLQDS